ncbi:geraniol 8-hydroxylase-like [Malania oleifera]|uniref:geraniol 8-hydroxylase-like n=1 Tax=Malania oleifera TaxID=397392 RepID=UPI0025AE6883|nr:geraniol 8-hydroxylase-like [Malania oleifera]
MSHRQYMFLLYIYIYLYTPTLDVEQLKVAMDFFTYVLFIFFTCALVLQPLLSLSRRSKSINGKLPPGPAPLPVVGNLLKLGNKPHRSLADLARLHGPIMTLRLGRLTTIVISSAAMAEEVLHKQDLTFSSRTIPDAIHAIHHHQFSMIWLPVSPRWRNLRKICNTQIFTPYRLDATQSLRRHKVTELLDEVGERCRAGEGVEIALVAFKTALNFLSNTVFSVDLAGSNNSDTIQEFKEEMCMLADDIGKPNLVDYFPVLRKIDPQGIRRRMTANFQKVTGLFDSMIEQRVQLRKMYGGVRSNDMLDVLLNISEEGGSEGIDRTDILHLLMDLFSAGTDTSSGTMEWAMAELLHNPHMLSKVQTELRETIRKGNSMEEADIACLPYLQAVVKEIFRLHPPLPLLLPYKAQTDTNVCGFHVPEGAQVLVNVWTIGRDPKTWAEPNSFVPERFLGSDIDVKGRNFELIPFGAGRRICPGLPLATRMIHLMLGSLLHAFDWKLEEGIGPKDMIMEDKVGLTLRMAQPLRAIPINVQD